MIAKVSAKRFSLVVSCTCKPVCALWRCRSKPSRKCMKSFMIFFLDTRSGGFAMIRGYAPANGTPWLALAGNPLYLLHYRKSLAISWGYLAIDTGRCQW